MYPRSTEDVVRIVKIANKYAIPLTPYAGGTALEGQCDAPFCPSEMIREGEGGDLPSGLSLVVNFSENMDTIIAVHGELARLITYSSKNVWLTLPPGIRIR